MSILATVLLLTIALFGLIAFFCSMHIVVASIDEHILWGLFVLIAPMGMTIFSVLHWPRTGKSYVRMCVSVAVCCAAMLALVALEGQPSVR